MITGADPEIVAVKVAVPVPRRFVASTVISYVPAAVGVPDIKPVRVFNVIPAGKLVDPYLHGEFDAVI